MVLYWLWASLIDISLLNFIKRIISCLEDSQTNYVIVGGIADTIWGKPKAASNLEMIIDSSNIDGVKKLEFNLRDHGFAIQENEIITALKENSPCLITHTNYPYHFNFHGVYEDFNARILNNRLKIGIYDIEGFIEKPEDLIIAKLKNWSEENIKEILFILKRQKNNLDLDYMLHIAKIEQVEGSLKQILSDSSDVSDVLIVKSELSKSKNNQSVVPETTNHQNSVLTFFIDEKGIEKREYNIETTKKRDPSLKREKKGI